VKTFVAQTADQWRTWLDEHRVASITYVDARDEALCFVRVDSLVKRLDD
jgi:hypothetical protein